MSTPTLAQLVTENPGAARILERHRLDYCCGGARTLERACADVGTDPDTVLAEIAAELGPTEPEAWTAMAPAELVDHIESTHHHYLHAELPRLQALLDKVVGVHGSRHPELHQVARVYAALRTDLVPHLIKEETILFPMIRQIAAVAVAQPSFHCGGVDTPIQVMMLEHDRAGEILAELRAFTDGYRPPADACASYQALYRGLEELEADTHLHVHKENNVLFPAVLDLERTRPANEP